MSDNLQKSLELTVKKLLRDCRDEPFESKINALKVAIVWFAQSRKIGQHGDDTGNLIDEMRKAIEDGAK